VGDGDPQGVHRIRPIERGAQARDLVERLRPGFPERAPQVLDGDRVGKASVPEQASGTFCGQGR
jgi:hypothetical protein